MPHATCTAIKADGVPCAHKAKNGGVCGTHGKTHSTPEQQIGYLACRINWMYQTLFIAQYEGVPERISYHGLRLWTREQLLERIAAIETAIRPHFAGWVGPFTSSKYAEIIATRVLTPRQRAEQRIPGIQVERLRVNGQLPFQMLHEWYEHFHQWLETVFVRINVPYPLTIHALYLPERIVDRLQPLLVQHWAAMQVESRRALWRCFVNLNLLGQMEIGALRNVLQQPPDAAPVNNAFVADNQNVHRTETVKYVTDIYNKLLKLPVPAGIRTLQEVPFYCKLNAAATLLFVKHYAEPVDIYELKTPYPKAMDAVWAYIQVHPEKEELYKRVADELTDNIGMCAQGNLSRICNILSGYLDGITPPVAKGELVQQKIAAIANDDQPNKVARGRVALRELDVPAEDWAPWIEALEAME